MKLIRKAGNTSNVLHIFISDSSKTDGSGLTGLVYNSSGLTAYYIRPGQTAATAITLAAITTLGTFVSGGFKEIDSVNMPGWYEFDPPDAAIATGAPSCSIHLKGATNMAPLPIEVQLDVNTVADNNALLTNGTYGLAQLTRSATPANTLAIDLSGRVTVGSNADKTGYSLSGNVTVGGYAAGQDPATLCLAATVEGTLTWSNTLRLILAASACKSSGGGTSTIKFRDSADTKDRITATVDSNGNRTAVILVGL